MYMFMFLYTYMLMCWGIQRAEAWRLIHSRYAPDTQNRQYGLMQKMMTPAKLWCDHAEGFESSLRAWELDAGEWERASGTALAVAVKYTAMMNMAPILFWNSLQLGTHANSADLRTALFPMVLLFPKLWTESDRVSWKWNMTGCKSTLSRKARWRAKANTKTRKEIARPARLTRALQTATRARTVAELDSGRKTAGDLVEERTTSPPVTATRRKARVTRKAKGKANTWRLWKRISLLQACRILHKHRVQLENSHAVQTWNRGSLVWQSIPCLQGDKLVQSICFLTVMHSFTHVRSSIQDKKIPRLQHDGGRMVTYKLPEGRTIRVLFHVCAVQKPILSLGCLAQQGYWRDLRADTDTLFFPDKIQTKHSQTQLHMEESLFFVERMFIALLSTAAVSKEVAQELQMPMGPRLRSRCLPSCNAQRSRHSRSRQKNIPRWISSCLRSGLCKTRWVPWMKKDFKIRRQETTLECPHVPSQPSRIPSPRALA